MGVMSLASNWERIRGRLRTEMALRRLHSQWRSEARNRQAWPVNHPPQRLLLLPGDPGTLTGARGDEAMMQGVVHYLRRTCASLQVAVVTASDSASAAAAAMGFQPLQVWESYSFDRTLSAAQAFRPDAAVAVGADIMDGYYGLSTPTVLLAIADLLALKGVRTCVLGFSFNAKPNRWLKPAFNRVASGLTLNVRDPISFERFKRFSSAKAQLVADAAFLMHPNRDAPGVAAIAKWAEERKKSGDLVLGFNLHPMLIKKATPAQINQLVEAAAQALKKVSAQRAVSWLLLPHDYRGALGDDECLRPLHAKLETLAAAGRVHRVIGERNAAELKALAGLADGVLTGRMHLAIASLGMGVPVLGFAYQDKFEGLLRHFDLSKSLLLSADQVSDAEHLERTICGFIDDLDLLRANVAAHLPGVMAASERNLLSLV
jgi:polysaccharide pyruvyl transferase WcaK-like protein